MAVVGEGEVDVVEQAEIMDKGNADVVVWAVVAGEGEQVVGATHEQGCCRGRLLGGEWLHGC